jgi:GxxExxY protein
MPSRPSAPNRATDDVRDADTAPVVEACSEVHRRLGPGFPRGVYLDALCHELSSRGALFQRHVRLPVFYRGVRLDAVYPIDVCVSAKVVVDVRAVDAITRAHRAELRAKLRVSGLGAGVLVNFQTARFGEGLVIIRRTAERVQERLAQHIALLDQPTLVGRESNDDSHALSTG